MRKHRFRSSVLIAFASIAVSLDLCSFARAQTFQKGVVVAREANAADAGRDALRGGGNAIDAAIATALVMAVTHPEAGNIGGGGFIVAYIAKDKSMITYDFREVAPRASTERMYLGADDRPLPHHRAGPRAAGVPGTLRGLELAHREHGGLPWRKLVEPAIRAAREGFAITDHVARTLNRELAAKTPADRLQTNRLADFPASVAAFSKRDRSPWKAGDVLIQPDLAATLERIADRGADDFYTGKTARLIVEYMKRGAGLITLEDLAAYRALRRDPIHTTYKGYDVYGMGPSASGGITIAVMLNILERYDLKADGPRSTRTLHRTAEAMRRGFLTRALYLGDPDFEPIDVNKLISKEYANDLAKTIDEGRATLSESLARFRVTTAEGEDTTHLSTIDAAGNAVALTYTLEDSFGSRAVVPGAGFLLNNEMGDFNLIPGRTDTAGRIGTKPNVIAPGKRMLSSQSPTIVLKDGRVHIVTGSPGGRTIPNTTLWVLLNVLEFGLDPAAAVAAPRTHHAWFPDRLQIERTLFHDDVVKPLERLGHRVTAVDIQGDAHTIVVDKRTGARRGVPDPRHETAKAAGD